jgi:acetylornithine deacetylase/succinyl-diaminopimelate desuccinylase-like protein
LEIEFMRLIHLAVFPLVASSAVLAAPAGHPKADAQALDLAKQLIAIRSVRGPDNGTIKAQQLVRDTLIAGGWADKDIQLVPVDDTAYLIATWPGSDPSLKPLVISGHLDVVEANPKDWQRDPFTPIIENGMIYGRGSSDMKTSAAIAIASLIKLRRDGFKPKRSIVIEFSGDEETTMKTGAIIADKLANADLVINIDGGGGTFDEKTGKPLFWTWDGAEKMYNDYTLKVTNPGGHSSEPRPVNAIVQMAQAIEKVGAYHFKTELNPVSKAFFENAAKFETDPKLSLIHI